MATNAEKAIVSSWEKMVDNAAYLGVEYRHKEKEYGIQWRAQCKIEIQSEREKLEAKFGNPLRLPGKEDEDFDPFEVIESILDKHWIDVKTFRRNNQYDMINIMEPTHEQIKDSIEYIKDCLKDPNLYQTKIDEAEQKAKEEAEAEEKRIADEKEAAEKAKRDKEEAEKKKKEELLAKKQKEIEDAKQKEEDEKKKKEEEEKKKKEEEDKKAAEPVKEAEEVKPAEEPAPATEEKKE